MYIATLLVIYIIKHIKIQIKQDEIEKIEIEILIYSFYPVSGVSPVLDTDIKDWMCNISGIVCKCYFFFPPKLDSIKQSQTGDVPENWYSSL